MATIKTFVYLLGMAFAFMLIFDKKFNFSLSFAMLFSTFSMLLFGYLGNLRYGFYFTMLILPISLVYLVLKTGIKTVIKRIIEKIKEVLADYGFYAFLILYLFVNWFHTNTSIIEWDEITFWSPLVREMFSLNKLYYVEGSAYRGRTYPPFLQLFELIFCFIAGTFEEKYLYRALSVFSIALFCLVFDKKRKNNLKTVVSSFLYCIAVVLVNVVHYVTEHPIGGGFTSFFQTILLDQWIGMLAAFSLFMIIKLDKYNKIDILYLTMIFSALVLSKQVGLPMFVMSLFLIVGKMIFNKENRIVLKTFVLTFVPISMLLFWNKMVSLNAAKKIGTNIVPIISSADDTFYWKDSINNFIHSIFCSPMITVGKINITYFPLCLIVLIVIIVSLKSLKKNTREIVFISITYVIGCIGWAVMMEYLYLTVFGSYEATVLASFERYMGTYVYMSLSLAIMIVYTAFSNTMISSLLPVLVLLILTNGSNLKLLNPNNHYNYKEDIHNKELFKQIDSFISDDDKVLVISQTRDYFIEIYLKYLYPNKHFSFASVNEGDNSSYYLNLSLEEWQEYYQNFDYIYLYNTDERFYLEYWKNVEDADLLNDRLYEIEDGKLKIIPWYSYQD